MANVIPYLNFPGNCREAMTFYKSCLQGEVEFLTFADLPEGASEEVNKDLIMHSSLKTGALEFFASDCPPGMPLNKGNNLSMCLVCDDVSQAEKFFNTLSQGGTVMMPLQQTSWAVRFGMLTDKFGVNWLLNCDK